MENASEQPTPSEQVAAQKQRVENACEFLSLCDRLSTATAGTPERDRRL